MEIAGDSKFWDPQSVPTADSPEFLEWIDRDWDKPKLKHSKEPHFIPKEDEASTWEASPNKAPYASFGEGGITASVNAYGDLVQCIKYFGVGTSGMFSLDQNTVDEPYMVCSRQESLQTAFRDRRWISYGLYFDNFEYDPPPKLRFVHDRWPRYEDESDTFNVSIQWLIRDGVVLQQYVLTNKTDEEIEQPIRFLDRMKIRDQDYIDAHNSFNDSEYGYATELGPHGYSWICAHQLATAGPKTGNEEPEPLPNIPRFSIAAGARFSMENYVAQAQAAVQANKSDDGADEAEDEPDDVVAVVSIFVNGKAIKWNEDKQWSITVPAGKGEQVEIVTQYKMLMNPRPKPDQPKTNWSSFLTPPSATYVSQFFSLEPFEPVSLVEVDLSSAPTVEPKFCKNPSGLPQTGTAASGLSDYLVRRHLEHILSVCAMPVTQAENAEDAGKAPEQPFHDVPPIALTCGDIAGHRVCTSASWFAFRFLVDVAKRLDKLMSKRNKQANEYINSLLKRIFRVLAGHMKWLRSLEVAQNGCFSANYWPTGKVTSVNAWTPLDSPADTAFQLAKAAEFTGLGKIKDPHILARDVVIRVCEQWLTYLEKIDRRGRFAWPHDTNEDINVFRLDDHVWIWMGMRAIETEDLEIWKTLRDEPVTSNTKRADEIDRLAKKFSSSEVQRDILRRFTTENDVSRKRMIAVTRSPRETRFMFHARDTALFYGDDADFFLKQTSFLEVWENTIEAQAHHDENQETNWDNALRYALAIVMGSRKLSINKRPPSTLVQTSLEVLLKNTSPNGFFGGQLDKTTKEPHLFIDEKDRDFYYHASFEIPYIFLTHAARISDMLSEAARPVGDKSPVGKGLGRTQELLAEEILRLRQSHDNIDEVAERFTREPKHHQPQDWREPAPGIDVDFDDYNKWASAGTLSRTARKVMSMKKNIPFNSLIDSTSIVEIDEEWLYNYPTFLMRDTALSTTQLRDEVKNLSTQIESDSAGEVIIGGAGTFHDRATSRKMEQDDPGFTPVGSSFVVDTPKQKHLGKQEKREEGPALPMSYNNALLWEKLNGPRKVIEAKKRLIWMPEANAETALACYLGSVDTEKTALSLFFDRHANYEKHFIDDTTMVLNTWESEFHLSFYQLIDADLPLAKRGSGLPDVSEDVLPGNPRKKITRASMGFRFSGDFFDRYWTCHFIEYIPAKQPPDVGGFSFDLPPGWGGDIEPSRWQWDFPFDLTRRQRAWRQRKILELHLFERILTELVKGTKNILDEIRSELGVQKGALSFSVLNSDDYFNSSAQWQKFQQILEAVEEELTAALLAVSKWESREKDRGQEKPRWTRNDERKYRGNINKLASSTSRKIRDLESLHSGVRSLKESLVSSQDQIRDDLGLKGAENIRFFTYVTVVFLPLGFAASVFSLNGAPPSDILGNMSIWAAVALVATVAALLNAKTFNAGVEALSMSINASARAKMRRSAFVQQRSERLREKRKQRQAEHEMAMNQADEEALTGGKGSLAAKKKRRQNRPKEQQIRPRIRRTPKDDGSWHVSFWFVYFFVELPAKRVLLAFRAIRDLRITWTAFVHIMTGLFFLPLFLLSWFVQVTFYNVVDLSRYIGGWLWYVFSTNPKREDDPFKDSMNHLTYPTGVWRPIKRLDNDTKSRRVSYALSRHKSNRQEEQAEEEAREKRRNGGATTDVAPDEMEPGVMMSAAPPEIINGKAAEDGSNNSANGRRM